MDYIAVITIDDSKLISSSVPEPDPYVGEVDWDGATSYVKGQRAIRTTTHKVYQSLRGESYAVSISNASPSVISRAHHGLEAGTPFTLTTTGSLPTGAAAGVTYYVVNPGEDTFEFSPTVGGTPVDTSSAGSGVQTLVLSTNLNQTPESSPLHWVDIGPTNRFAMFDEAVGTQTVALDEITVVLAPGFFDGMAAMEMVGAEVQITMDDDGDEVFARTIDLDATVIDDYYPWFFAQYAQRTDFGLVDVTPYYAAETTVTITGTAGSQVGIGILAVGPTHWLGGLEADGASAGIVDFTKKVTDEYGRTGFQERPYSRKIEGRGFLTDLDYNRIYRLLAERRAKPGVLLCKPDNPLYDFMISFGICASFSLVPQHPQNGYCLFQWEGLT